MRASYLQVMGLMAYFAAKGVEKEFAALTLHRIKVVIVGLAGLDPATK
jgi:hypothetical protein